MKNNSILNKFLNGVTKFNTWLAEISGWVVVIMMLTITYDVLMRYIFGMPTKWSFQLNTYLLLLVVFFSAPWTSYVGGHVEVDLVINKLSEKRKTIIEILVYLLAAFYLAIFTFEASVYTIEAYINSTQATEYYAVPLWPVRSLMAIGGVLLFMQFIVRIINNIQKFINNEWSEQENTASNGSDI